jgi:hypothetical protein
LLKSVAPKDQIGLLRRRSDRFGVSQQALRLRALSRPVRRSGHTSGSVAVPGPYVPQPLSIMLELSEQSAEQHAREILALTKLNWNNNRLDGREPITTRAARSIGTILRHVPSDSAVGGRHAFYV